MYFYDADFERFDDTKYCSDGDGFEVAVAKERDAGGYKVCNFSLPFADEYIKAGFLQEGRKILIMRCAIGATSFYKKRWGKTDDLFLRMLKAMDNAMQLNYGDNDHRFVAFLWHQGESDTDVNPSKEKYYNDLKYLVESVRNKANNPSLPFIAGDFVQDWKTSSQEVFDRCVPIVDALRCLTSDLERADFVESEGLLSNRLNPTCPVFPEDKDPIIHDVKNDNIHFCRDAQMQLGKRYFEKFMKLR